MKIKKKTTEWNSSSLSINPRLNPSKSSLREKVIVTRMPTNVLNLAQESVWLERSVYEKAEEQYAKFLTQANSRPTPSNRSPKSSSLADEIARARQHIKHSLQCEDGTFSDHHSATKASDSGPMDNLFKRVRHLEAENKKLLNTTEELRSLLLKLENRIKTLERDGGSSSNRSAAATAPSVKVDSVPAVKKEEDDDVDLFGSDEEDDEEKEKLHQERLKAYEAKKAKKPALIAKSNIILDVKPWDDETDMKAMETQVRSIEMDGLVWGASKLVPLAFGIHKLQISCVVEDEKVSVDLLQEKIQDYEDLVQSVDIAAFNKV